MLLCAAPYLTENAGTRGDMPLTSGCRTEMRIVILRDCTQPPTEMARGDTAPPPQGPEVTRCSINAVASISHSSVLNAPNPQELQDGAAPGATSDYARASRRVGVSEDVPG
jgi:hypothetical protein